MLQSWQSFRLCCWSEFGHQRERDEPQWWRQDQTWHQFFHEGIVKSHSIQQEFHHQQREYHHLYKIAHPRYSLPLSRVMKRALEDTDIWLWAWEAKVLVRDRRYVSSKTRCLMCVGVGRSDGRHKANPSFHAITKISRILGTLAMLMMGINKSIKETQYHNSISKAVQEQTGDRVVWKMISLRQHRSMSPEIKMLYSLGHTL